VKFIAHGSVVEYESNDNKVPYVHQGAYFKLSNYTRYS